MFSITRTRPRVRRSFQPAVDGLPLRLAPSTLPMVPEFDTTHIDNRRGGNRSDEEVSTSAATAPSYCC